MSYIQANFTAAFSVPGTYTWTCPPGVAYAYWTCAGTSTFNGSGTGSNSALVVGTGYPVFVDAGGDPVNVWWFAASPCLLPYNTAGGIYQFSVMANAVLAEAWAPGGAGGGGLNINSYSSGGGGGEYAAEPALVITPGTWYTFAVGAAGQGVHGTAGSPGASATTIAGDTVTVTAHPGGGGGTSYASGTAAPGAGGTGSASTVHYDGGTGGTAVNDSLGGAGGGSSAGSTVTGHIGFVPNSTSGAAGGGAPLGGAPGGYGGNYQSSGLAPAYGPGGGGGGAGGDVVSTGGSGWDGQAQLTFTVLGIEPLDPHSPAPGWFPGAPGMPQGSPFQASPLATSVEAVSGAVTSAPGYASAFGIVAGGTGSWVNPANAEGAPDGTFATWTAG